MFFQVATIDPLTAAERSQGILTKDLATGVIVGLAAAVVALAVLLVRAYASHTSIILELLERHVTHLQQDTASNIALADIVRERLPARRPQRLAGEPKTNPGVPT